MKEKKFEISLEKDIKSDKETLNKTKSEEKFDLELKNIFNNIIKRYHKYKN